MTVDGSDPSKFNLGGRVFTGWWITDQGTATGFRIRRYNIGGTLVATGTYAFATKKLSADVTDKWVATSGVDDLRGEMELTALTEAGCAVEVVLDGTQLGSGQFAYATNSVVWDAW